MKKIIFIFWLFTVSLFSQADSTLVYVNNRTGTDSTAVAAYRSTFNFNGYFKFGLFEITDTISNGRTDTVTVKLYNKLIGYTTPYIGIRDIKSDSLLTSYSLIFSGSSVK